MKRIILIALALMLAGGAGRATAMDLLRLKIKGLRVLMYGCGSR